MIHCFHSFNDSELIDNGHQYSISLKKNQILIH